MTTVIAIDGPVGSGKSTVARAVAARLGLEVLETGAMYRALALAALRRGIVPGPDTVEQVAQLAREVPIEVGERVLVDGADVTSELRGRDVNEAVSAVAAEASVRAEMVQRQRQWVDEHGGGVVEGRDIGTVVFPDATLKVFLTASEEERARRREGDEDADAVARRDRLDSSREASPLTAAGDAVVIDTTGRDADDVVEEILRRLG